MELSGEAKIWLKKVRDELTDPKSTRFGKIRQALSSKTHSEEAMPKLVGRTLGPYEFGELIGVGSMGLVFEVTDLQNREGPDLAVKILLKPASAKSTPEEAQLFAREVEIGQRLQHPTVVRTLEARETSLARYVIMERVRGTNFVGLLESPWPVERCLSLFKPLVEGLQYAHDEGVVHRDIKPENLMLTDAKNVKILDFGLASLQGSTEVTMTGQFKGTPMFSSPEQVKSTRQAGPACDQFSLALILFQALSGQFPYPVDPKQPLHTLFLRLQRPADGLRTVAPEYSEQVEAVLAKMLTMEPEDRYPRLEAAFEAFEAAVR